VVVVACDANGNVDLADLDEISDRFIAELVKRGGYTDLDKSLKLGLPEIRVLPDREKAAELGVDASTLAQVVQLMVGGLDVGVFKEGGSRYDIRMRLERKDRDTPAEIENLYVRGSDGKLTELRNLMKIETGAAPSAITRSNRQRSVTVSACAAVAAARATASATDAAPLPRLEPVWPNTLHPLGKRVG